MDKKKKLGVIKKYEWIKNRLKLKHPFLKLIFLNRKTIYLIERGGN